MLPDVKEFVAACPVCSRGKSSHRPPAGLLQLLLVPQCPLLHVAIDFVTGLPPSEENTVILMVVYRFSKMVHIIPLPKLPSAMETADLLVAHVFRLRCLPTDIVSDCGPQFTS